MSSRCMPSLPHNSLYLFKTVCNSKKPTDFGFNIEFYNAGFIKPINSCMVHTVWLDPILSMHL